MDALLEFWSSPRYADMRMLRQGLAGLDVWAVPGFEAQPREPLASPTALS